MKQAGVEFIVRLPEIYTEPLVNVHAVKKRLKPAVGFDAPVFADTQEDKAVNCALNGKIKLALGEVRVSKCDIFS